MRTCMRFARVTSWEQYKQVFGAIVRSNGWDDATAALQLLSHLERDLLSTSLFWFRSRGEKRELVWLAH